MYKFERLKELSKFVELLSDDEIREKYFKFYNAFPYVGKEDGIKLLEKLSEGRSLESLINSYKRKLKTEGFGVRDRSYKAIYTMEDCFDLMMANLDSGVEKGTTTYIPRLDEHWTWRNREFNIWSGYVGEGKSEFINFICLIRAIVEGTKIALYSPENYPPDQFFDNLIHMASGKSTDKDNRNFIGKRLYKRIYEQLKELFFFVHLKAPENDLLTILEEFSDLITNKDVKVCIIDPLLKVQRPKIYMNADDKYAAYFDTVATEFAREYNISLHMVMHQLTPPRQDNGLFPKPSKYTAKGGGSWVDGCDNFMTVWRPVFPLEYTDPSVMFSAQKIKKPKLVGIVGDWELQFDTRSNRFVDKRGRDLFDFKKYLNIPEIKLLHNPSKSKWHD